MIRQAKASLLYPLSLLPLLSLFLTIMAMSGGVLVAQAPNPLLLGVTPGGQSGASGQSDDESAGQDSSSRPPLAIRQLIEILREPHVVEWLQGQAGVSAVGADGSGGAGSGGDGAVADPAAADADGTSGRSLHDRVEAFHRHIEHLFEVVVSVPNEIGRAVLNLRYELTGYQFLAIIMYTVMCLLAGYCLEEFVRGGTTGLWRRWHKSSQVSRDFWGRTLAKMFPVIKGLWHLTLFACGSLIALLIFPLLTDRWGKIAELFALTILLSVILVRLTGHLGQLFLHFPVQRASVKTNRSLYHGVLAIGTTAIVGYLFCHMLDDLGFFPRLLVVSHMVVTTAVYGLILSWVWVHRGLFSELIHPPPDENSRESSPPRMNVGGLDPAFALLMLALCVSFVLSFLGAMALSLTLVILTILIVSVGILRHVFKRMAEARRTQLAVTSLHSHSGYSPDSITSTTVDEAALEDPRAKSSWREVCIFSIGYRLVRIGLVLLAIFLLALTWQDVVSGLQLHQLTVATVTATTHIVIIVLVADLLQHLVKLTVNHHIQAIHDLNPKSSQESGEGGGAVGEGARALTLLPLLKMSLLVTIWVVSVFMVMSELGIDIAPLLAGAGIIGIAIGFGAQSLVRDIFAGIFFLLDDAFRVGEYVEIGELRGTVEAISLRSLRIRHHRGAIHTLPFGEMRSLTNYSRDWIIMKLEFRVPFDTDLAKVKKLVKKVGQQLLAHPEYGPNILEPPKSQGVRRMEEFNMVVGVKFMTKPGEQWVMRRETYQRILAAFEANDIRLASRQVVVQVAGNNNGGLSEQQLLAAAEPAITPPPMGQPLADIR